MGRPPEGAMERPRDRIVYHGERWVPERKWLELRNDLCDLLDAQRELTTLVDEQAEDEALWAIHPSGRQPIAEAYLQRELRRLHAAVEAVSESRPEGTKP